MACLPWDPWPIRHLMISVGYKEHFRWARGGFPPRFVGRQALMGMMTTSAAASPGQREGWGGAITPPRLPNFTAHCRDRHPRPQAARLPRARASDVRIIPSKARRPKNRGGKPPRRPKPSS